MVRYEILEQLRPTGALLGPMIHDDIKLSFFVDVWCVDVIPWEFTWFLHVGAPWESVPLEVRAKLEPVVDKEAVTIGEMVEYDLRVMCSRPEAMDLVSDYIYSTYSLIKHDADLPDIVVW